MKIKTRLNFASSENYGVKTNIYKSDFFAPPKQTREGFLLVDTILARKCVLPYQHQTEDGEIITANEFIGDDIYKSEFLESAEGLPFVYEHPQELDGSFVDVTPDNYKSFTVGVLFNVRIVSHEGERIVIGTLKIWDKEIIELVLSKKLNQVSQGYKCIIVEAEGEYNGVEYQLEQKELILNHLALVKEGRAGDTVRLLYNSKTPDEALAIVRNSKEGATEMTKEQREELLRSTVNGVLNQPDMLKKLGFKVNADDMKEDDEKKPMSTENSEDMKTFNMDMDALTKLITTIVQSVMGKGAPAPTENTFAPENVPDKSALDDERMNSAGVSTEIRKMVASHWNAERSALLDAQAILGDNAVEEYQKCNSLSDFKKAVLVKSGMSEDEVKKLNGAHVDAHFSVAVKTAKAGINEAKTNSAGQSNDIVSSDDIFVK